MARTRYESGSSVSVEPVPAGTDEVRKRNTVEIFDLTASQVKWADNVLLK